MTSRNEQRGPRDFDLMTGDDVTTHLEVALRPIIMTAIMNAMRFELPARPIILRDALGGPHQAREQEVILQTEYLSDQDLVDITMLQDWTEVITDLKGVDLVSLAGGIADALIRGMAELQMIKGNARLQLALFSGAAIPIVGELFANEPKTMARLLRAKANGTGTDRGDAIIFNAAAEILDRVRIARIASNDEPRMR